MCEIYQPDRNACFRATKKNSTQQNNVISMFHIFVKDLLRNFISFIARLVQIIEKEFKTVP